MQVQDRRACFTGLHVTGKASEHIMYNADSISSATETLPPDGLNCKPNQTYKFLYVLEAKIDDPLYRNKPLLILSLFKNCISSCTSDLGFPGCLHSRIYIFCLEKRKKNQKLKALIHTWDGKQSNPIVWQKLSVNQLKLQISIQKPCILIFHNGDLEDFS